MFILNDADASCRQQHAHPWQAYSRNLLHLHSTSSHTQKEAQRFTDTALCCLPQAFLAKLEACLDDLAAMCSSTQQALHVLPHLGGIEPGEGQPACQASGSTALRAGCVATVQWYRACDTHRNRAEMCQCIKYLMLPALQTSAKAKAGYICRVIPAKKFISNCALCSSTDFAKHTLLLLLLL